MNLSVPWLLLAVTCIQLVLATTNEPSDLQLIGRRQLAPACARSEQCGANQFCLPVALSASSGVCAQCWRCCLFPDMYGGCPDKCQCNIGAVCETRDDCGNGLFCSVEDPWEMPTCQRCDRCTANAFELQGSCVIPCPSSDMSRLSDLPLVTPDHFLFLAFLAHDISQQGAYSPGVLLKTELDSWVQGQGLKGTQADQAVSQMLLGDPEAIDTQSWMQVVSETSSTSYICPAYDPEQPWTRQPALTTQGCYCNATANARTFRCPAGQRCSPATFLGLETDAPRDPTAQIFRAVCLTCEQGQHCPEGTYLKDERALESLECPSGYYCPTPAVMRECPPGAFCTGRTTSPVTCDMQELLLTDPNKELTMKPDTVIERVRDKRDPLRGNYCPVGSTRPNDVCSAGYYCPNASTSYECPKGHYCKAQSTAPWKCPLLTRCPPGTAVPALSFMALVVAAIVICTIPLLQLAFTHLDNSVIMEADELSDRRALHRAAVASRMTFRLLKSIKVNHQSALENKYRGFGTVSPPITMEFESLGLRIRPRGGEVKNVLMGVSGSFAPRRLNAILGPSGCGKTTFLNVLCGKISNGTIMGQVRVNSEDIPIDRLKKIMGFVPQDDIVHEDLTVRENLNYSARLRLPSDMTRSRRRDIVHDALEMLGLSAIQHYRVGTVERRGISGGQRKRVNIGLELVAMPSLLFLDEPTSGLDATSSADILNSLVDMANLGMNIIMVIHQPRFSSFLMFDQVLLLGGGGHTVYLGSPSAAMLYFTKYLGYKFPDCENPSDILMDIIAGRVPCIGDPRIKTCAQLVEKWTTGGMAWVDTLETLNPTMVTKMSEVDPAIILAIDEEFDALDVECTGQINAVQLVKLFGALKQDISLDDAIVLIRKVNAHRPASAKAAARSGVAISSASTPRTPAGDADGLTVTKQQLLDAFQGVREANDEANADGAVQRNAAAKFYASHFLLPDLPEVKNYRAAMERRRRRQPQRASSTGNEVQSNSGYDSNGRNTIDSMSAGGYSNIDSDSYSLVGQDDPGATPVVESILRRSILTPTGSRSGLASSPGDLGGAGGNRTVRSVAMLPGLTLNGSATSTAKAATGGGGGGGVAGGTESDGVATGDLSAYAARQRYAAAAAAAVAAADAQQEILDDEDGEYDDDEDDEMRNEQLPGYNSQCVMVSSGVIAGSLAAMEALAHADVPLPQLPRRMERSVEIGQGREKRHTKIFNNIKSYVKAYNELATAPSQKLEKIGRVGTLRGHRMSLNRSGTFAGGAAASAAAAIAAGGHARRRSTLAVVAAAAGASAGAGRRPPRLRIDSPGSGSMMIAQLHASLARPARLSGAEEEAEDEFDEDEDRPTADTTAALPPLLRALVSGAYGIITPMASIAPGPVSEGMEGGGEDPSLLVAQQPQPAAAAAVAEVEAPSEFASPAAAAAAANEPLRRALLRNASAVASAAAATQSPPASPVLRQSPSASRPSPLSPRSSPRIPLSLSARPTSSGGSVEGSLRQSLGGAMLDPTAELQPPTGETDVSPGAERALDLEQDPTDPDPAQQWSLVQTASGRQLSGSPDSGVVLEASRDSICDAMPNMPPVVPAAPRPSGDARHWRRFAGSLPRGSVGSTSAGSQPIDPAGDRPSRAARVQPSRFANSRSIGGADGSGGGGAADAAAADGLGDGTAVGIDGYERGADGGGGDYGAVYDDDGGAAAAGGGREGPSMDPLLRTRLTNDERNASAPLPMLLVGTGRSNSASPAGTGRPRRASLGPAGGAGRKQRRHSWLQNPEGHGGGGEPTTPGGSRKTRKDTLYVNSLLSNALVGAWAATQSITGRNASALGRLTRAVPGGSLVAVSAATGSPEGGSPMGTAGAVHSGFNTPLAGAARAGGLNRSIASTTGPVKIDSRVPSSNPGGVLGSALVNRLDMEEAVASRKAQRFTTQLLFLLRRGCIKYVRSFWPMRVMDTLLQLAAAFIIGLVHGTRWGITAVPSNAIMCMVCLGVLSCVTHLRTFSNNRVLLWRESASGMSILAYFLSLNLIDQIWVFAAPGLNLGVYYYLTLPRMSFSDFYVVGLFVCWWASGMAYLVSAVLPPQNVLMAGVFISLIFGAFLNGLTYTIAAARGSLMEGVMALSYNRWAMEIVTINELRNYQFDHRNTIIMMGKGIGLCSVDTQLQDDGNPGISPAEAVSYMNLQFDFNMDGYCEKYKSIGYASLFSLGLGFRLLAFVFLRYSCIKRH